MVTNHLQHKVRALAADIYCGLSDLEGTSYIAAVARIHLSEPVGYRVPVLC